MTDPIADSARAAADRLAAELGPELVTDVEAELHTRQATRRPDRYLDPISLGGLIVSVATLAWNVYTDLKSKTPSPAPDVVARTVRVELGPSEAATPQQRDRIIEIVVSETVQAVDNEH
jgi:hypothetical protein